MFFLRLRFWLTVLKLLPLTFLAFLMWLQVPEIRYDTGPKTPVAVSAPDELRVERFPRATFVAISGRADFGRAFVYRRYGLSYTYFNIAPFGTRLVVRTYDEVTDDWETLTTFLGKLRPFAGQPFSYKIRAIYAEEFGEDIPADAFFLALEDVPRTSGWQVGALVLGGIFWAAAFYALFVHRWKRQPHAARPPADA